MVNYGFILVPLYIYPYPLSLWQPLFNVAASYPNVTFQVGRYVHDPLAFKKDGSANTSNRP